MKRIALFALLLACNEGEIADLDASIERLKARREQDLNLFKYQPEYREKVSRVDEDIARVESKGLGLPITDTIAQLRAKFPDLTFTEREGGGWTVGADVPAAKGLSVFAEGAAFLSFSRAVIEPGRWWVEIPAEDFAMRVSEASQSDPLATPTPGRFPSGAAGRRRMEIEKLRREIDDLEKQLGDVTGVMAKEARLTRMLHVIGNGDRLRDGATVALALQQKHATVTLEPAGGGDFDVRISTRDPQSAARDLIARGAKDVRQTGDEVTARLRPASSSGR